MNIVYKHYSLTVLALVCTQLKRKGLIVIYCEMKLSYLRAIRTGFENARCPLYLEEEDVNHKYIKLYGI